MKMPNFLIFGAAKSGTTSLYRYLQQHPEIYMSSFKEPGFFAFAGEKPQLNGPGAQKWVDRWVVTDLEEYQKLFEGVTNEKAIGEASPYYIYYEKSPVNIKKYIPNVKLIAILRNPVDRAFSNYVWAIRDRSESLLDFGAALEAETERIKDNWGPKWRYQDQGFYHQQLKRYYDLFEREQIKIYLYDDFITDPVSLVQDIFRFLEVNDTFVPDMSKRHNTSLIPKNKAWHEFLSKPNAIKSIVKPFLPLQFRQTLRKKAEQDNLFKPKLEPQIRKELTAVFQPDILQLQQLIEQDLSRWLDS